MEALALLLVIILPIFVEKAEAAGLQQAMVRLDRMTASTATTGTVCMKTAVTDVTESNVVVTFPDNFTVNAATNWTVSTAADIVQGSSLWTGILTATNVTGQAVTFPSSNLTANTLYCFNWISSAALTTNSSTGSNQTGTIASGGNSSSYATAIVTSSDQINVTATVPTTFAFSLSANASPLGTLSSTSVSSGTGIVVQVGTNAASGWVAWVKSANAALNSVSTGASIATPGTINNTPEDISVATGNPGYVLDVALTTDASGGCTLQQNPGYGDEYDGDADHGGSLSTSFQPMAECVTGTANNDQITLTPRARISATQAAATDYADTLTVVGAGRF